MIKRLFEKIETLRLYFVRCGASEKRKSWIERLDDEGHFNYRIGSF
jgi:hypothetical protein